MSAWLLDENGRKFLARLLDKKALLCLADPVRLSILETLSERPMYVKELVDKLKLKPSIAYYHIKKLQEAGLIRSIENVRVRGAIARKFAVTNNAYAYLIKEDKTLSVLLTNNLVRSTVLESFYSDAGPNFTLVVGSAEPHGVFRARSYDHRYAIELAFFLGKLSVRGFIKTKLDTEVKEEDLYRNLILVGGPIVNVISYKLNSELPIKFIPQEDNAIYSTVTGKSYREDSNGVIELINSPFSASSKILILAGKRLKGTEAAIFALVNNLLDVSRGNVADNNVIAHVVEGYDTDGDGAIDSVEIME